MYLAQPIPQLTRPITWNLPFIGTTKGLPLSPCNIIIFICCLALHCIVHLATVSSSILVSRTQEVLWVDSLFPEKNNFN